MKHPQMMAVLRWVLPLLLLAVGGSCGGSTDGSLELDKPDRMAPEERQVWIGFHVLELSQVNIRKGEFQADLYYWIRYRTPQEPTDTALMENLEFMNGNVAIHREVDRKAVGDWTYVAWRVQGAFHWLPELQRYPLDTQKLPIRIEHANLQTQAYEFIDDDDSYRLGGTPVNRWGIGNAVRVPDYDIKEVNRNSLVYKYETNFGDPEVVTPDTNFSRFELVVHMDRRFEPYLIKILVPLIIILTVAYLVFFVPADALETAAALTVTSLLASIAFQMTLASGMPENGYMVTSDRIFHLCYLLIMLAMSETVLTFNLEKNGHAILADRIEVVSRWVYPLGFLVGLGLILWKG
jgi:hypothetical protein